MNNSSTHSFRRANHYTTSKIFTYLEGLAAKLGVTVENRSYHQTTNNAFMDMGNSDAEELPFAPSTTATSLEGMLG